MENANVQQFLPYIGFAVFIIIILVAVSAVRSFLRMRRRMFGGSVRLLSNILSGALKSAESEAEDRPLSLSNIESLCLPEIKKKYPGLNIEDLRNKAGVALKEYLDSVQKKEPTDGLLEYTVKSLSDTVRHVSGEKYANVPFMLHRAVISEFANDTIKFDIAYKSNRQRKATVEFARTKADEASGAEPQKNCAGCGAVLTSEVQMLGNCLYCGQVFRTIDPFRWAVVRMTIYSH